MTFSVFLRICGARPPGLHSSGLHSSGLHSSGLHSSENGLSELCSAGRWGAARFGAIIAGFVPETVVFLGVSPPIGGKGIRMVDVNMGVFEGETHVLVCLSIDE